MYATYNDIRFNLWKSEDGSKVRVYVEWLHTVGVKNPRWEKLGWIDGKSRGFHNDHGNIELMMEDRGITLREVGKALTGK